MTEHHCRVCGIYYEEPPWGYDNNTASFDICNCCGVEFGFDDYTIELVRKYRKQWLDNGALWRYKEFKPVHWDLNEQMNNIPKGWL